MHAQVIASAMAVDPLPDRWIDNAHWLAQAIDPANRHIRLVRLDESSYRSTSFLDDRMLHPGLETRTCSLDVAMAEASTLQREDARWIFHLGHVGSTLVSRLLGELDDVLAIREPRSLRDLMAARGEQPTLAHNLCRLFSRVFAQDQKALVKTTSFVSELAPLLVPPNAAVLFLYVKPQHFIAGRLAGKKSLTELAARRGGRVKRLGQRAIKLDGFDATNAHRAAAAWACEMTSMEAASHLMSNRRILWLDFDVMLTDMAGELSRCADHFNFKSSRKQLADLANGSLMSSYSKAPHLGYSPTFRAQRLAEAMRQNSQHIEAAVSDLKRAAQSAPLLDRALRRAGQES